jgi:uncharacterized protein YyaL (SSP411 family)
MDPVAIQALTPWCKSLAARAIPCPHVQGNAGIADDYAEMARAALALREITGDNRFLAQARAWTGTMNSHFWNDSNQRLLLLCR